MPPPILRTPRGAFPLREEIPHVRILIVFLLLTACARAADVPQLVVQNGHSDAVSAVDISADGRLVVTGSWDNTVKVWDRTTASVLATMPTAAGKAITVSLFGDTVAVGTFDGPAELWSIRSARRIATLGDRRTPAVTFSPDGRLLATAGWGGKVTIWDARTRKRLRDLPGNGASLPSLTFDPRSRILAVGTGDWSVLLWDVASGRRLRTITARGHQVADVNPVLHAAFNGDGTLVAVGSAGNEATEVHRVASGKRAYRVPGEASAFAFSGDTLAVALDGRLEFWKSGRLERRVKTGSDPKELVFSKDGRWLAAAPLEFFATVHEVSSGKPVVLQGRSAAVTSLDVSDGWLATADWEGTATLWSLRDGGIARAFAQQDSGLLPAVALSGDGRFLAAARFDKTTRVWRTEDGAVALSAPDDHGECVALDASGRTLASGNGRGEVRVYDVTAGKLIRKAQAGMQVTTVGFNPGGTVLASRSDQNALLWDVPALELRKLVAGELPEAGADPPPIMAAACGIPPSPMPGSRSGRIFSCCPRGCGILPLENGRSRSTPRPAASRLVRTERRSSSPRIASCACTEKIKGKYAETAGQSPACGSPPTAGCCSPPAATGACGCGIRRRARCWPPRGRWTAGGTGWW